MNRLLRRATLVALTGATMLLCAPASGWGETSPVWSFRLLVGSAEAPDAHNVTTLSAHQEFKIEEGWGAAVQVERRVSPRAGLQLSLEEARFDAYETVYVQTPPRGDYRFERRTSNRFKMRPLKIAFIFHLGHRADFYGGPEVAWVRYDPGSWGERESELGAGVVVGIDYPIRGAWALSLQGDYLATWNQSAGYDIYNSEQLVDLRVGVALRVP